MNYNECARNAVTTGKRLTKIATADAVDKRVAAAGREDERLCDSVENTEYDDVVAGR